MSSVSQLDLGFERWSLATGPQLTELPSEFLVGAADTFRIDPVGRRRDGLGPGSKLLGGTVVVDRPLKVAAFPISNPFGIRQERGLSMGSRSVAARARRVGGARINSVAPV